MIAVFDNIGAMIVLTGALTGIAAAIPGTFLVLRGSAMLTDAIGHSIVLGIVLVWMATGATTGPVQIIGAALAGLATVFLVQTLEQTRLVRADAAIGLVFPALFALGVLLINLNARNVHIDAHSVLLGEIGFVWIDTVTIFGVGIPRAVVWLGVMVAINVAVVAALWKELKLTAFDPDLAAALGFRPRLLTNLVLALTAATAVAAFDAVGVILFVAFAVVPAATAVLLTDRLGRVIGIAVALAGISAIAGYPMAVAVDASIGGMMALMTGAAFAIAFVAAPRYGLIASARIRVRARYDHDCHTLAAHLYSHAGTPSVADENSTVALAEHLNWAKPRITRVILQSLDRGLILRDGDLLVLTPKGRAVAQDIFFPATTPAASGVLQPGTTKSQL